MQDYLKDERYENVMIHVMGSYIISYCEYRGESHDVLERWVRYDLNGEYKDNEEISQLKSKIGNLYQRYNNYRITPYQTFKIDMVVRIIVELNTGRPIMDFVKLYFAPQKKIASWERINDSFSLENDDFLVFYDELIEDVCNLRIYGMSNLGYSMAYLLSLDSHKTKESVMLILIVCMMPYPNI